MRVISWNMNHWQRSPAQREDAWRYLRDVLRADVALAQEAVPPESFPQCFRPIDAGSAGSAWGSAVVVLTTELRVRPRPRWPLPYPRRGEELADTHPGTNAVADILDATDRVLFTAVSLYARFERMSSGEIYACATFHRVLSDLTPVLDTSRNHTPVLVAGDFNLSTQEVATGTTEVDRRTARAAFARLEAFGLRPCIDARAEALAGCSCREAGCRHVRTYRHQNNVNSRPTQLDYAYASSALSVTCSVHDDAAAWNLSDHAPLVMDIGLPST